MDILILDLKAAKVGIVLAKRQQIPKMGNSKTKWTQTILSSINVFRYKSLPDTWGVE